MPSLAAAQSSPGQAEQPPADSSADDATQGHHFSVHHRQAGRFSGPHRSARWVPHRRPGFRPSVRERVDDESAAQRGRPRASKRRGRRGAAWQRSTGEPPRALAIRAPGETAAPRSRILSGPRAGAGHFLASSDRHCYDHLRSPVVFARPGGSACPKAPRKRRQDGPPAGSAAAVARHRGVSPYGRAAVCGTGKVHQRAGRGHARGPAQGGVAVCPAPGKNQRTHAGRHLLGGDGGIDHPDVAATRWHGESAGGGKTPGRHPFVREDRRFFRGGD